MKHGSYLNRALRANDPRYARVLGKLGYNRSDMAGGDGPVVEIESPEGLDELRSTYHQLVGKKPYHGWDAATLADKIKAAKAA